MRRKKKTSLGDTGRVSKHHKQEEAVKSPEGDQRVKRQEVGRTELNAASCSGQRDESTETRQQEQRASLQHTGQIKPFWSPAHRTGPV